MSRHLDPTPSTADLRRHNIAIASTLGLAVLAATCGIASAAAPDARNAAAAQPTIEQREPTGHGGPIGPLALPSIGADGAWQPEDGPVVVDGQPLPAPAPITTAPVETETAPEPEPVPPAAEEPAPTVDEPTPEPTDDPVIAPPEDPEVTDPEVTDPEVTDPEVTDPPAEPTTPVVEVTP